MIQFLQGDCVEQMRTLLDASVEMGLCSPPYGKLRTYGGGLEWDFMGLADELYRVLVPGGVLCWNVGDEVIDGSEMLEPMRQAIYFRDKVEFLVHDTMIYEKTNFGHPEKARYHQLFEYIFVLSKGRPRTFNPIKDKPNAWAGTGPFGVSTMRNASGEQRQKKRNVIAGLGMRGNVWRCKTAGQENVCTAIAHPAVMPLGLARDLILSFSNPGETVLDPMAGSGTSGQAALELGRKAILIEKKPEYVQLIREKCNAVTPGLPLIT